MTETMTDTVIGAGLDEVESASPPGSPTAADISAAGAGRTGAVSRVTGELVAAGRALRSAMASVARRAGAVAERSLVAIGSPDTQWWEPASRRLVRRTRSRVRRSPEAAPEDRLDAPPRTLRWGQALAVGLAAFSVWALFDAPTLLRSAEASPFGARRTAAITLLRPVAAVSRDLGLSHVVGAADRVLGRTGGAVVQDVGPPVRHRPRPPRHHVGAPSADTRPTSPATPSDALPPLPAPSAAAPLRVLSVGDSLGVDFGGPFVNDLAATGVVNAVLDAHVDTGLARPDYFDWPGELQADLAKYQPQVVVVFLGANDPQNGMVDGSSAVSYGTPGWSALYASRVGAFMQEATTAGARVLWVGMPPMSDPDLNAKMQVVDGIYQSQAGAHPGVTYLSSWPVLSDAQGAYAQYLPDASGSQVAVREPDGTHMSPGGAERLSGAVIDAMDHTWGLTLHP